MPPVAAVLAAVAAALETVGLGVRLFDVRGALGHLLSMDLPGSLPRLFVASVLAAAAVVAALGAWLRPGRRVWWSAVAASAVGLAAAKAAGDLHVRLVHLFGTGEQAWRGAVVLGIVTAAGLVFLWRLSGNDRRDRRRIVTLLAGYAVAAVGLSLVSTYARITAGPVSAAFATFVEESGEALTAAGLLVAVLIGVLPRLVLPAGDVLRRRDDHLEAAPLAA
ncbi:hypothetical protein [Petropleomorpha daqingensis]|uniref:Uncharacterized protein n=1 Tax=Petropleomorpha daqingensis TaxID=2026353 RepID=A0A853CFU8_9ACTN|nr:hypothetical protein [Petropleomorpha daqingensis]NYJ05869.1 hypothetical protein [Petropleomorpha daqingensis]